MRNDIGKLETKVKATFFLLLFVSGFVLPFLPYAFGINDLDTLNDIMVKVIGPLMILGIASALVIGLWIGPKLVKEKEKEWDRIFDPVWRKIDLVECLLRIAENADKIESLLNLVSKGDSMHEVNSTFEAIKEHVMCDYFKHGIKPFIWVGEVYRSLYLNDVERLKSLVNEARIALYSNHIGSGLAIDVYGFKSDFYLRLIEYHYLLANSALHKYYASMPYAISSEAPAVTVPGGWDNVLFEGSCSFKFGGVSQWRDGVIRVTGAGVELEGKLKVRSMNLTALAIKAAARAAGVGEVNERIPYSSISSYDYDSKKVVIHAYGKKYVIKTPAASHIGSLLDNLVRGQ